MKWKHPPIPKIYEALGTVADNRVEVSGGTAKVFSSTGNKFYEVTYDPEKGEIMLKKTYAKNAKILIVDDDHTVRTFLERFLKDKGYADIQSAKTGEDALKIIQKEEKIDLVLLDIKLPGMGGLEVLRKIKEMKKDTGVIMITGFPDEKIGREAMKEGASDYIMKPFDLAYLELSVFSKIVQMVKEK